MIACFPDPYPDEVLYSICARYSDRVDYPRKSDIIEELFGENCKTAKVDLVRHLEHLLSMLPPGHRHTATDLINNHTLLPYYRPFISTKRTASIVNSMVKVGAPPWTNHEGGNQEKRPRLEWLRFCPLCVDEDRENFGETYWHRLHQLPGVYVCSKHNVLLEDSGLHYTPLKSNSEFTSAEKIIEPKQIRQIQPSNTVHSLFLKLAKDISWLLTHHNCAHEPADINKQYMRLARKNGFMTKNGKLDKNGLLKDFTEEYNNDVLALFNCEIEFPFFRLDPWLYKLITSHRRVQHPVRHFLLIYFFRHTVETFFQEVNSRKIESRFINHYVDYFGKGPWPCCNPRCDFFEEQVIEYFCCTHNQNLGEYIASFTCPECKSTYSQKISKLDSSCSD